MLSKLTPLLHGFTYSLIYKIHISLFFCLQLIGGLADEKGRWQESVKRLEKQIDLIVGDVLISAGAVAYLGPFTVSFQL